MKVLGRDKNAMLLYLVSTPACPKVRIVILIQR